MPSISLQQSNQLKAIAILMMLCLHLFNRDYHDLFQPLIFIGSKPLSYYVSLFCDACVPVFAFVSGYGLYYKYRQNKAIYAKGNIARLKKLYVNYWVVILLFAVILGWLLKAGGYPGSWTKFLLNLSGFYNSYNSAWWYFTIYVLFVLTSGFWFRLLDKINPYIYFSGLLFACIVAFYFRIYKQGREDNVVLSWLHTEATLYFCTLFQLMLGAFFLKYDWNKYFYNRLQRLPFKNILLLAGMVGLVVIHGIIPNFIIAPFTGLGFIFLYINLDLSKFFNKLLDFLSPHSTNLWLIHMFFYMIFFRSFVYSFRYPPLIFIVLVLLCLVSSFVVNFAVKKMNTLWD